jgi:hypothetical protein
LKLILEGSQEPALFFALTLYFPYLNSFDPKAGFYQSAERLGIDAIH